MTEPNETHDSLLGIEHLPVDQPMIEDLLQTDRIDGGSVSNASSSSRNDRLSDNVSSFLFASHTTLQLFAYQTDLNAELRRRHATRVEEQAMDTAADAQAAAPLQPTTIVHQQPSTAGSIILRLSAHTSRDASATTKLERKQEVITFLASPPLGFDTVFIDFLMKAFHINDAPGLMTRAARIPSLVLVTVLMRHGILDRYWEFCDSLTIFHCFCCFLRQEKIPALSQLDLESLDWFIVNNMMDFSDELDAHHAKVLSKHRPSQSTPLHPHGNGHQGGGSSQFHLSSSQVQPTQLDSNPHGGGGSSVSASMSNTTSPLAGTMHNNSTITGNIGNNNTLGGTPNGTLHGNTMGSSGGPPTNRGPQQNAVRFRNTSVNLKPHNVSGQTFPLAYTPAPAPSTQQHSQGNTYQYSSANGTPSSLGSRQQGSHHTTSSQGSTLFNKFVPRKAFSTDKKWNGTHEKFSASEAALNSYALTSGMPYMINHKLTSTHTSGGNSLRYTYDNFVDNDGQSLADIGVSYKQFQHDCQAMYGAIELLCEGKFAKDILRRYKLSTDGIATYTELLIEFKIPASVRTNQATAIINQPYHSNFHGGISAYLSAFKNAYAILDEVAEEEAAVTGITPLLVPDNNRLAQLRNKLIAFREFHPMLTSVRDQKLPFRQAIQFMQTEVLTFQYATNQVNNRRRRANFVDMGGDPNAHSTSQADYDDDIDPFGFHTNKIAIEPSPKDYNDPESRMLMAINMSMPEGMRLPQEMFNKMSKTAKYEFIQARRDYINKLKREGKSPNVPESKADQEKKKSEAPTSGTDTSNSTRSIPAQYPTRANTSMSEQTVLLDPLEFHNLLSDFHSTKFDMNTARTSTEEPAADSKIVYIESRHMNISWTDSEKQTFLLISDNGANGGLISTHSWKIMYVVPNRRATVHGAKNKYISRGNRIGAGRAVVVTKDNELFGIEMHEQAIHDEKLTLLSEFQVSDHGVIVNSKSKKHLLDHEGTTGLQMISPEPDVTIPLEIRNALATLQIRKPTDEEMKTMKFHKLTSDAPWVPRDHSDDHFEDTVLDLNYMDIEFTSFTIARRDDEDDEDDDTASAGMPDLIERSGDLHDDSSDDEEYEDLPPLGPRINGYYSDSSDEEEEPEDAPHSPPSNYPHGFFAEPIHGLNLQVNDEAPMGDEVDGVAPAPDGTPMMVNDEAQMGDEVVPNTEAIQEVLNDAMLNYMEEDIAIVQAFVNNNEGGVEPDVAMIPNWIDQLPPPQDNNDDVNENAFHDTIEEAEPVSHHQVQNIAGSTGTTFDPGGSPLLPTMMLLPIMMPSRILKPGGSTLLPTMMHFPIMMPSRILKPINFSLMLMKAPMNNTSPLPSWNSILSIVHQKNTAITLETASTVIQKQQDSCVISTMTSSLGEKESLTPWNTPSMFPEVCTRFQGQTTCTNQLNWIQIQYDPTSMNHLQLIVNALSRLITEPRSNPTRGAMRMNRRNHWEKGRTTLLQMAMSSNLLQRK